MSYVSGTLFGSYKSPSFYKVYADSTCILNKEFSTSFYDISKGGTNGFSFKLETTAYASNGSKVTLRVKTSITD